MNAPGQNADYRKAHSMKRRLLYAAAAALTLAACQDSTPSASQADASEANRSEALAAPAPTAAPSAAALATTATLTPRPAALVAGEPAPVIAHPDPLSVLHNDDPALAANKRLLFDMWRTVLNAGHLEVADDYIAEDYIQYSPFQRSGRDAVKATFSVIPRRDEVPDVMRPSPVTILAEDDLVVLVAVEELPEPDGQGSYSTTHFNMFRVTDGRLSAHWHPDQTAPCPELPTAAEGGPQPVTGFVGSEQYALLEAATPELANNKRLVFDMWRHLLDAGREELAELYLAEDYIQHNPTVATGRQAVVDMLATFEDQPIETSLRSPLVAMLAEGDLVLQVLKTEHPHPHRAGETYTSTWFDLFRIADGRIAEHWDAAIKPGTNVVEMGSACAEPQ
jgi:predicted SnoaL-like aldol condensation-catalyzing enzyme